MVFVSCLALLLSVISDTVFPQINTADSMCRTEQIEKDDTIEHAVDSLFIPFENDTITFSQPTTVSQIVYTEHKESPNAFYGIIFPVITLILGVAIDRSAQMIIDKRKMKRNGERWKNELESCVSPIQKQIESLSGFVHDYCDNFQRYDIPGIPMYPILKGTTFASLNKEDLQDYLECKKGSKITVQERFYKITTFVMSLEMIYQSFMEAYDSFKKSGGHQVEMFSAAHLNYSQLLLAAGSKVPVEMTEDDYNKLIEMRHYISGLELEKGYLKTNLLNVIEQYNLCLNALDVIREYFP